MAHWLLSSIYQQSYISRIAVTVQRCRSYNCFSNSKHTAQSRPSSSPRPSTRDRKHPRANACRGLLSRIARIALLSFIATGACLVALFFHANDCAILISKPLNTMAVGLGEIKPPSSGELNRWAVRTLERDRKDFSVFNQFVY